MAYNKSDILLYCDFRDLGKVLVVLGGVSLRKDVHHPALRTSHDPTPHIFIFLPKHQMKHHRHFCCISHPDVTLCPFVPFFIW